MEKYYCKLTNINVFERELGSFKIMEHRSEARTICFDKTSFVIQLHYVTDRQPNASVGMCSTLRFSPLRTYASAVF